MKKSKILKITAVIFAFIIAFIAYGLYNPLSVSKITVNSSKIYASVRIALVSDLHSSYYGEKQVKLINAINSEKPDIVCLVGDIFDDERPKDNAEVFLAEISSKYPCFFVTGNHECRFGVQNFQEDIQILEKYDIVRLSTEVKELELHGQKINICGIEDPWFDRIESEYSVSDALTQVKNKLKNNNYTVLLSHRPDSFPLYADFGFDLILCGHAHGGQWRIPLILNNGLVTPELGFFPKYTNGKYDMKKSTMVVSRGLAKNTEIIPRFYNRPEIVIIELK